MRARLMAMMHDGGRRREVGSIERGGQSSSSRRVRFRPRPLCLKSGFLPIGLFILSFFLPSSLFAFSLPFFCRCNKAGSDHSIKDGRTADGPEIQELLALLVKEEEGGDVVAPRGRRAEDRSIFPFSRFFISSESH